MCLNSQLNIAIFWDRGSSKLIDFSPTSHIYIYIYTK